MKGFFAKEHDLLKLCDNFDGSKIHYCPYNIRAKDANLFDGLKRIEGFASLRHHCVFSFRSLAHSCLQLDLYPISKEEFCLAIADMTASVISRKLNIGFRRGPNKRDRLIWNTYHMWVHESVGQCSGNPPNDLTVLGDIQSSASLSDVFQKRLDQMKDRSEDAWKCPFASLLTHSELTEKWFQFFVKNHDYFQIPEEIGSRAEALKHNNRIRGPNKTIVPPVCFLRIKLFANQSLSRIADVEIIERINAIVEQIPHYFDNSQELYTLADEIILVIPRPAHDLEEYVSKALIRINGFTTNYYFEANIAETWLRSKDLLIGYDSIFQSFRYTFYPKLENKIDPKVSGSDPEAYSAKLCELCNMAEATKTFRKSNDEAQKVHECLCERCFEIRVIQDKSENEEDKQGIIHGRGYQISRWERNAPRSKLCFVKIDLDLSALSDILKDALLHEFPLRRLTDRYSDENIGFSIIHEFLTTYREFIMAFHRKLDGLDKFNISKQDLRTNVPNRFDIFDSFLCLRFDEISEFKAILQIFIDAYTHHFPQFRGLPGGKNKAAYPITFSTTISDIKFPFFEAWRYLNRQKESFINILAVRHFELRMSYAEYQKLNELNFRNKRISSFLHRLAEMEKKSRSRLVVHSEIFNHRFAQSEIFKNVIHGNYTADQLINYYKLVGGNREE